MLRGCGGGGGCGCGDGCGCGCGDGLSSMASGRRSAVRDLSLVGSGVSDTVCFLGFFAGASSISSILPLGAAGCVLGCSGSGS